MYAVAGNSCVEALVSNESDVFIVAGRYAGFNNRRRRRTHYLRNIWREYHTT